MIEAVFPQSPNWHLSKIMSVREDGSVAYGSQNNISILEYNDGKMRPVLINDAHSDKITSVSFCPLNCHEELKNSIMSSSEDGYVKLWSIGTLMPLKGHKSHWDQKDSASVKVVCASWVRRKPQHIVSAADNNTIVLWNVLGNNTTKFHIPKLHPTVIECSNISEDIVACGSANGLIYVLRLVNKGETILKIRAHDKEVQALAWSPEKNDVGNVFLASSSQEKFIRIWSFLGTCVAKLPLPKNAFSKERDREKLEVSTNFVPLLWTESYNLYSGTRYGELISCNLEKSLKELLEKAEMKENILNCWALTHSLHSNMVMAVACSPFHSVDNKILEHSNGSTSVEPLPIIRKNLIWTIGKDQKLIAVDENCQTGNPIFDFHTLNGHPYHIAVSPHDPNKIALAGGDGRIRLWSASRPSGNSRVYHKKINDRVYSLAWHPTREGLLAFGTSGGRVGVVEVYTLKQPTTFGNSVLSGKCICYRLSWGPPFSKNDEDCSLSEKMEYLYGVCNGLMYIYNYDGKDISGRFVQTYEILRNGSNITDLCWKPDRSILALGTEDGSIYFWQPSKLPARHVVLGSKKYIQSLTWHPTTTTVDADCSNFEGYFTFGSTDKESVIKVYSYCSSNTSGVDQIAALKGHTNYISSVSWSPHNAGQLISCSADFSVRMWDVTNNTEIAKFVVSQSFLPLFCISNPVDPDVLIAGLAGKLALSWRISTVSSKSPLVRDVKVKKGKNIEMSELLDSLEIGEKNKNQSVKENVKRKESNDLPLASEGQKGAARESSIFSKAWKLDKDQFEQCYNVLKENENRKQISHIFPLLGTEDEVSDFLSTEAESLKKSNKWSEYYEICMWRGNLGDVLEEKIKTGQLDDFLMALAPSASPFLWKQACNSYAESLAEKKLYRKAAAYLLAARYNYKAVEMLLRAGLYLEAICVEKFHGGLVKVPVIEKYAEWLAKSGSYLKAAVCYISVKRYDRAVELLGMKNHVDYLSLAALASKKARLEHHEKEYALRALVMSLESQNRKLASRICSDHENLRHLSVFNTIYEEIMRIVAGDVILEQSLINHLINVIGIREDSTIYAALEYIYDKKCFYSDVKKLYVTLARELALVCCAVEEEIVVTHIIRAMNVASRYMNKSNDVDSPLYKLCCWLFLDVCRAEECTESFDDSPKIISVQGFLCQGIAEHIDNVYAQKKECEFEELLRLEVALAKLVDCGLDREAFIYYKNHLDIKYSEKVISEACQKKIRSSEESDDTNLETMKGADGSSNGTTRREKEFEKCDDLDELIDLEKEKIQKLKEDLKSFENARIIAPNPALLYLVLRNVYEASPNKDTNLKNVVEEKWKELQTI